MRNSPDMISYEGVCRYFKSRKIPPPPIHPHHHDNLIEEAEEELASLTWPELMTAGGLAGVVAWIVRYPSTTRLTRQATFPLDVVKTRMQAIPWDRAMSRDGVIPRISAYRVASEAVRSEGWRVLFAGLGPTLIRFVITLSQAQVHPCCLFKFEGDR
jgi:solute carrier family 25 carnitine/acylcarnitine transporter 20/29